VIDETVALYYTAEILRIIDTVHSCGVLHCDVKPDNFLVILDENCLEWSETYSKNGSTGWAGHGLQLIDFGRAVDTLLLPEGTVFTGHSRTDGFECIEMRDNCPWTKQLDLYGVAATVYCLIHKEYLKTDSVHQHAQTGKWTVTKKPKRSWDVALWNELFDELLNLPNCDAPAPTHKLYKKMEEELMSRFKDALLQLQNHYRLMTRP
jgi:checkpoint serine/threonine-protein kinase